MGGSAPTPPNPAQIEQQSEQLAANQYGYNKQAQSGSNYNQFNPYGSLQYVQGTNPDGSPRWDAISQYSAAQAPLWAQAMMSKELGGLGATALLGGAGYGFNGQPSDVIGNSARGITGDIVGGQMAFLDPFQTQARNHLDNQLRNQGLEPGNTAYDNAMRGMDTSQMLARGKILSDVTPTAYQIAQQQYNTPAMLAMALGGYGNPVNPASMYGATTPLQPPNSIGAFNSLNDAMQKQFEAQQAQYSAGQNAIWNTAGQAGSLAMMGMMAGML